MRVITGKIKPPLTFILSPEGERDISVPCLDSHFISKTTDISTHAFCGRLVAPAIVRACFPFEPNICVKSSPAPSMIFAWSRKSTPQATKPVSSITRRMRASEPPSSRWASASAKMAASRAKGRGGWQTCPVDVLWRMLREHVEKGDPVDVANLAMMIHHNSHRTE